MVILQFVLKLRFSLENNSKIFICLVLSTNASEFATMWFEFVKLVGIYLAILYNKNFNVFSTKINTVILHARKRDPGGVPHPRSLPVRRATFLVFPQYSKEFGFGVVARMPSLRVCACMKNCV